MDKPQLYLYKLHFTEPLHIGNERQDYASGTAFLHSDALYAAVFHAWASLGKTDWIPTAKNSEPAFAVTSLFPFFNDTYFLPRPLYSSNVEQQTIDSTSIKKKIKKVTWVDTAIFQQILNDQPTPYYDKQHFNNNFWSAKALPDNKIIDSKVTPRAKVPRTAGEDTTIFYIDRYYFAKGAGLYFLAQFDNHDQQLQLETALRLLADEGIGTDRNIGHGKFSFEQVDAFSLNINTTHQMAVALGLYCPANITDTNAMIDGPNVGYDLLKRGGWLSEPYQTWRKRSVYMFKEGSVLQVNTKFPHFTMGENIDIKPTEVPVPHPVWRCGKTIFLSF